MCVCVCVCVCWSNWAQNKLISNDQISDQNVSRDQLFYGSNNFDFLGITTSKRRDDGGIEIKITLKKADPKFFRIFCKLADNSNDGGDDDDIAKLGDESVL